MQSNDCHEYSLWLRSVSGRELAMYLEFPMTANRAARLTPRDPRKARLNLALIRSSRPGLRARPKRDRNRPGSSRHEFWLRNHPGHPRRWQTAPAIRHAALAPNG